MVPQRKILSSTESLRYDPRHFSRKKGLYFAYKGDKKFLQDPTHSADDPKAYTVRNASNQ